LIDVMALDALDPGVPVVHEIGGREIVIVRTERGLFAVRNVCPHQSQSFASGRVRPWLTGGARLGDVAVDGERTLLACPWHSWVFDLTDGRCAVDPKLRVAVYRAEVRNGRVLVDAPWATPADVRLERLAGPRPGLIPRRVVAGKRFSDDHGGGSLLCRSASTTASPDRDAPNSAGAAGLIRPYVVGPAAGCMSAPDQICCCMPPLVQRVRPALVTVHPPRQRRRSGRSCQLAQRRWPSRRASEPSLDHAPRTAAAASVPTKPKPVTAARSWSPGLGPRRMMAAEYPAGQPRRFHRSFRHAAPARQRPQ
jgi:nitrite reductase/ring-hydroxylating ferredoxin subunit